jgi:hypothetical protein
VSAPHVPVPSQLRVFDCVDPAQDCATHVVPLAYFWHVPAPSHEPFVPHVAAPWFVHSLSGSLVAPWYVHVPTEPVLLHARHDPEQSMLQQTPSEQTPVAHSVPLVQAWPCFFLQMPATQP